MFVRRGPRMFADPVLPPHALRKNLPVSTAEELLRVEDFDERPQLARAAADKAWDPTRVHTALHQRGTGVSVGTLQMLALPS